ncbi:MAG TPA: tetratricopeptide repeat protein [Methyloceanibacter sp.]|nr:tetratricopeptide repeat protein [Methyloceanibacter sp.]
MAERLRLEGAALLAALFFAATGFSVSQVRALDIELPADVAPGDAEILPGEDLIEPEDFDSESLMRPDLKPGEEGAPPPQSTEDSKEDKLPRSSEDGQQPVPLDRPKMLAQLYQELRKAPDKEAAGPIMQAIQGLWRTSGSPTVDLLMQRTDRFTTEDDLDLALEIIDAALEMAPEEAEAWYLRGRLYLLKKDYGQAIADLRRALDRDPNHYEAMNELGAALQASGARQEALEAYRKTLALNPFHAHAMQAEEELRREVEGRDI